MTSRFGIGWLLAAIVSAGAGAQMHRVTKPEVVVRAIGVYEWTGDMAKPTASRLIPVTVYIDNNLQDAGVYLARPVPFALDTGNVYELDQAGVSKGTLELQFARHLQATNVDQAYDDGWFGYGAFKPLLVPKKLPAKATTPARTAGIETNAGSKDSSRPHFSNRSGSGSDATKDDKTDSTKSDKTETAKSDAPAQNTDPDRPTMKRRDSSDSADSSKPQSGDSAPANDPDRPTMKRRSDTDTASTTSTDSGTNSPANDPDRPTLKKRSPEEMKKRQKENAEATVSGVGSLNDDPDRPNLHRGRPTHALTAADFPKLAGLPADLQQMVAVSDAVNRPTHDFSRPWDDDAEKAAILEKMQAMARAQLAAYGASAAPPAQQVAPQPTRSGANSKLRRPQKAQVAALLPVALQDEQLHAYELSYGDVPTFVYQAHTEGTGADLRYVTVVAQRDAQGEPQMVLHNVTDAAHLDRIPRMRLVDAVDVEASNRASLLFEMRGQASRQFALYRVLGQQAQQIFATGTTQ